MRWQLRAVVGFLNYAAANPTLPEETRFSYKLSLNSLKKLPLNDIR